MNPMHKKPKDYPFHTHQVGTTSGIRGFDDKESVNADVDERNTKAKDMGIKARYEVVKRY